MGKCINCNGLHEIAWLYNAMGCGTDDVGGVSVRHWPWSRLIRLALAAATRSRPGASGVRSAAWLSQFDAAQLKMPVDSQGLVFSKTSFQPTKISPQTPRALYFNDDVYIGWVQNGEVIEIAAVDRTGTGLLHPAATRQSESKVHPAGFGVHAVPSVDADGRLVHVSDAIGFCRQRRPARLLRRHICHDRSESVQGALGRLVRRRQVRGPSQHGQSHLHRSEQTRILTPTNLKACNLSAYLGQHSDVVALTVLAHQTHLHNLIAQAHDVTMNALQQQADIEKAMGGRDDVIAESTRKHIAYACEPVVRGLLFSEEAFSRRSTAPAISSMALSRLARTITWALAS